MACVEFLQGHDVDLDVPDMLGNTAREIALRMADPEVLQLLKDLSRTPEESYVNGIIIDTDNLAICANAIENNIH